MQIEDTHQYRIAFTHLGFRPFFAFAGIYATIVMLGWWWLYRYQPGLVLANAIPVVYWHGHEMIYGYAVAVIAGFLLTAVRNWTNVMTLHGMPLILLALLWLVARLSPWLPVDENLLLMAVLDLGFNLLLLLSLLAPILRVKQWPQMGILLIVLLLTVGNSLFYLGAFGQLAAGMRWSIYAGTYLVVLLIMVMGRRVIPFFIEKGVEGSVRIHNRQWLDIATPALMLLFLVSAVFLEQTTLATSSALVLFVLQCLRLYDWHTPGLWKKPLLWSLYLAYAWIVLGFGLYVAGTLLSVNPMLALHAFAYGGIGLMTLSMMCRVALGHTGRNVFAPPSALRGMFILLFAGAVVRVILSLAFPAYYALWIAISQWLWIGAFATFVALYLPMLVMPRIDGRYG